MKCSFCDSEYISCPLAHERELDEHKVKKEHLKDLFELAVQLRERENVYRQSRQRVESMLSSKFIEYDK